MTGPTRSASEEGQATAPDDGEKTLTTAKIFGCALLLSLFCTW